MNYCKDKIIALARSTVLNKFNFVRSCQHFRAVSKSPCERGFVVCIVSEHVCKHLKCAFNGQLPRQKAGTVRQAVVQMLPLATLVLVLPPSVAKPSRITTKPAP